MVYSLILPFAVFLFDALADAIKSMLPHTEKQGRAWHRYEAFMLAFLFVYIAFLLQDYLYPFYVMLVRFWFFNILLNLLRKRPLFYLGGTSRTDVFIRKSNIATVSAFIGSFILSIIYIVWLILTF